MTAASKPPSKAAPPEPARHPDVASPEPTADEWAARLVAKAARILRDVSGLYTSYTDPATLIAVHSLDGAAKALEHDDADADFLSIMFSIVAARHLLHTNVWLYHDLVKRRLVPYDDGLREAYDQARQGLGDIVDAFGSDESEVACAAQDSDKRMTKGV
jgi:hypothetical protein